MQPRKNPVVMLPSLSRIIPTAEPQWVMPSELDLDEQVCSTWEEKQVSASSSKHWKHFPGPEAVRKTNKILSISYKYEKK